MQETGSTCALLRFDNLVKETRVQRGRGHVGSVSAFGAEGSYQGRIVLLLLKGWSTIWCLQSTSAADGKTRCIGKDGSVEIGRNGDEICDHSAGRWEEGEGPLGIDAALGPADDTDVFVLGDAADVVDGIGDVLGVDLDIAQTCAGEIEPDGISVRLSCEQLDQIGSEGTAAIGRSARHKDGGWLLAIGESRRDINSGAELSFCQRVRRVVGSPFWIHGRSWSAKIDVGNGILANGKQA